MIKDYIDPDCVTNPAFFDSISEIVVCSICSGILINPQECSLCQNSFCKKCLNEWACINSSCPYKCDNSEFKDSSRTLKNLLEKLLFKCMFCNSAKEELSYLLFLNHLKTCEKVKVNCPTCDSLVNKNQLNENKFYSILEENYNNLAEKYKNLKEENKKLKEEVKLQSQIPIKNFINNDINFSLNKRNSVSVNSNNLLRINNDINLNSRDNNGFPNDNSYLNLNQEISEIGIIDKCEHFKGNYIPIFSCCEKSFPCYICHNTAQNHEYKMSSKVVCLICKNIYTGPRCNLCNTYQIYRKK